MAPARTSSDMTAMRDEILARVDAVAKQVEGVAADTREARDATIALKARLTAENTQEAIAAIWARIEKSDTLHRQDLQNTYNRVTEQMTKRDSELEAHHEALATRTKALEDWRNRIEGANVLVRWLSKYAPWLVAAAGAVYGYMHGGGKIP